MRGCSTFNGQRYCLHWQPLPTNPCPASVEWWSLPSSGLPPRYEHAAFFVGQDLAVYGGAEEKGPLSDVWKYVNGALLFSRLTFVFA